jgi:selenoprotein W-related protein
MDIKLEFCVVWNYTPRAVSTIEDILEIYGQKVSSINLIPGSGGVFEFYLNETLLYSKLETGRHTEEGEILSLIEKALSWPSPLT